MTTPPKTIQLLLDEVSNRFSESDLAYGHGTDNPQDEAAWLLCALLDISLEQLENDLNKKISDNTAKKILAICEQRIATRKPLAYLINEAWFAGHKFYVDERVIVPRSHIGGFILDEFQPWVDATKVNRILDLCTGSGCIGIAAALALPGSIVDLVDISKDALAVTNKNIVAYDLQDRVHTIESDLFSALSNHRYDLILTNPPYVGSDEYSNLPPEYGHEPKLALHSHRQGLEIPLKILAESAKYLNPNGHLVMEVGASAQLLEELLPQVPFTWLATASGETSIFLLTAAQLTESQHIFTGLLH